MFKNKPNPIATEFYGDRSKRINTIHRSDSIFTTQVFSIIMTALFVLCDAITIKSLWNAVVTDNAIMNWLLTISVACVLNVPLAIAGNQTRKHQQGLTSRSHAMTILVLSVVTFGIVFVIQLLFRLDMRDLIFGTAQNGLSSSLNTSGQASSSNTLIPAIFSGVLPMVTSIASFVINLCSNPLNTILRRLKKELVAIESNLDELQRMLQESYYVNQHKDLLLAREDDTFKNFVDETFAAEAILRNAVRVAIMELLQSADDINILSEDADNVNKETSDSLYNSNGQETVLRSFDYYKEAP